MTSPLPDEAFLLPTAPEEWLQRSKRFQQVKLLGEGAFSRVFQAFDCKRNQSIALKTLPNFSGPALEIILVLFERISKLNHRNLLKLYEMIQGKDCWFVEMELIQGTSFLSYIREEKEELSSDKGAVLALGSPIQASSTSAFQACSERGLKRLRKTLPQMVEGLMVLHEEGLIHRDVAPENVLVTPEGRLVIIDYGMTSPGDQSVAGWQGIVGSPAYMAPEQGESGTIGPAADWYALGVLLFEALTGAQPFSGSGFEVLLRKQTVSAPRVRSLISSIPKDLDELVGRLLDRNPKRRPSGLEILTCLKNSNS
jgi:eukaryotic-like serine/threonine-protein kinase